MTEQHPVLPATLPAAPAPEAAPVQPALAAQAAQPAAQASELDASTWRVLLFSLVNWLRFLSYTRLKDSRSTTMCILAGCSWLIVAVATTLVCIFKLKMERRCTKKFS